MARIFVEGNVDAQYVIRLIPFGSLEHTKDVITLTKDDLKQPLELMPRPYDANISIVVKAKGTGVVHLRAIHKRWSRAEMGQFIMGVNVITMKMAKSLYTISILVI